MSTLWPYLSVHLEKAAWACALVVAMTAAHRSLARRFGWLETLTFDKLAMSLSLVAYGAAYRAWGEHTSIGNGFGWDGQGFGAWAKDWHRYVFVLKLDHYKVQKALPSGVVHYAMRAAHVERTDSNVILAFTIAVLVCFVGTTLLWTAIATHLALSRTARWLGFVLFFASFAGLKIFHYIPVLLDPWGMFLGAIMFYLYLRRWTLAIVPLAVVGGFVIPGYLPLLGSIFLFFPRVNVARSVTAPRVGLALGGVLGVAIVGKAMAVHEAGHHITNDADQVIAQLLPLSAVLLAGYVASSLGPLLSAIPTLRGAWSGVRLRYLPVIALIAWGIPKIVEALATPVLDVTPELHQRVVLLESIAKPLVSVVASTAFLGPLVVLMWLLRRAIGEAAWTLGPGAVAAFAALVVLGIDSESRHLMLFLPVGVTCVALAYDRRGGGAHGWVPLLVACLGILTSKAWVPLESPPLGKFVDGTQAWPYNHATWQRFFMNLGPWIWLESYAYLAVATLVVGIALRAALKAIRVI